MTTLTQAAKSVGVEFPIVGGASWTGPVGEKLHLLSPADGATEVGACHLLPQETLEAVILAAQRGFEAYRSVPRSERMNILERLAEGIAQSQESLAKLITAEVGKPLKFSRQEVSRAIALCRAYAHWLETTPESTVYMVSNRRTACEFFPIGPVLAITPFNFPLNLVVHKLAPAIAAGCSFTLKPSLKAPLTALTLGKIALKAGYPALSVVPCMDEMAEALVQHTVFRKFSFTGSSAVGWRLRNLAGNKDVTLECGGNAACIIEDVPFEDLDDVAKQVAQGAYGFSGQICISTQRLFVYEKLHDRFLARLVEAIRALKVGNPMDIETDVGPMISLEALHRSRNLIKDAIQQGANVVYGGNTYNMFTMNPTLLNRTTPEMAVNAEEVFAPMMTVSSYASLEEAIQAVNHSRYGLQVGVYTQSYEKIQHAYRTLDVGGVVWNDVPTIRSDWMPYGGVKDSGLGQEGVLCGVSAYSIQKTLIYP